MAVVEEKNKVQQVLDFRKLNKFVECGRSDVDACDEKLRSWRQKLPNSALLDLHDIYTKISVADECSKYQIVKFGGNFYKLSWLRFGLNCAPEIKKAVGSKVLSLDEKISKTTEYYYDDIIIDLNVISAQVVKEHFIKV